MNTRAKVLLAASLASALAVPMMASVAAAGETAHCYGVNKCKGVGACSGKGHSCSGQNACKGQGYIDMDKDTCLKLEGGRLTPEAPAKPKKP